MSNESKFIVWEETRDGDIIATLKNTRRAAKVAYGKIERERGRDLKTYGWAFANDAYPTERVAAGLPPFPTERVSMPD